MIDFYVKAVKKLKLVAIIILLYMCISTLLLYSSCCCHSLCSQYKLQKARCTNVHVGYKLLSSVTG